MPAAKPQTGNAAKIDQMQVSNAQPAGTQIHASKANTAGTIRAENKSDSSHHFPKPVIAPATNATTTEARITPVIRS